MDLKVLSCRSLGVSGIPPRTHPAFVGRPPEQEMEPSAWYAVNWLW